MILNPGKYFHGGSGMGGGGESSIAADGHEKLKFPDYDKLQTLT